MREIPEEVLGPKLRALRDDRRRKFAFLVGSTDMSGADAAREAGYSNHKDAAKVAACRLMQSEHVVEAIEEVARVYWRSLGPVAIRRAGQILDDKRHPAHARMIEIVLDRSGYGPKSEQKVVVEHTASAEFEALAARFAPELGVARAKLTGGNVIDGRAEKADEAIEFEGSADIDVGEEVRGSAREGKEAGE